MVILEYVRGVRGLIERGWELIMVSRDFRALCRRRLEDDRDFISKRRESNFPIRMFSSMAEEVRPGVLR